MTSPGPIPERVENAFQEIPKLWAAIREQARKTLYSAAISAGRLVVQDGAQFSVLHDTTQAWVLHVGRGSQGKWFLTIRRDDGSAVFEVGTTGGGQQFGALWDRNGHIVVSDDATGGSGLARPWLPLATMPTTGGAIPMTDSATYTSVWTAGYPPKQQPYCAVMPLLRSDSGATGNARWTVNGTPVGTVTPITANFFGYPGQQMFELPGELDSWVNIELQVQRTNAVGTVGGVFTGYQRQSP